jgi:GT2 family glycosyltransferase
LNDDVEFEQDLVSRLLEKHYEYPNAIISPLQESPTGTFLGMRYVGMMKKMQLINYSVSDISVDTTNGCCLLVPCEIFKSVGLIDSKHCPHQYGDTEFQLRVKHAGFSIMGCPSIRIKQLGATDYYLRLKLFSIFTFKGSPLYIKAYVKFGKTLFLGNIKFYLLGIFYHFSFIKVLIKALFIFSKRSLVSTFSLNYFK